MVKESLGRLPAGLSRRAALTGGGVVAAGVGAFVFGATRSDGGGAAYAATGVDVRDTGATGDGHTDDTEALQRAIDMVRDTGGMVTLPPGTYLTGKLILHSRVHLRGAGGDATTLKLAPGSNSAILETVDFDLHNGTDGGPTLFSVRDLTLDGNRAQNPKTGYGLRIYGYGYELSDIIVFNCQSDGIYSAWGETAALPTPLSHQMEARLSGVRSHENGGHGFNFAGPHDSLFVNCTAHQNLGAGFRLTGWAHGTQMVNCHGWGIEQNISFDLGSPAIGAVNCYADLNGGIGVRISQDDCRWVGGFVLGYNHPTETEIGVQFVAGTPATPAGCTVDTRIVNCGTAAIDFGADRGMSSVRATYYQPGIPDGKGGVKPGSGLGWIGTPAASTRVDITQGVGDVEKNLVISPAFDLRAQATPAPPGDQTVRVFARETNGKTQLCVRFPNGAVKVLADG